jgi:hypothetical protein
MSTFVGCASRTSTLEIGARSAPYEDIVWNGVLEVDHR